MGSQKLTRRQHSTPAVAAPAGTPKPVSVGDGDELDHAEATRGDGDDGQNVGQPVGHQQVDGDDVGPEGEEEDPQRGGIEEPVGRRPDAGPVQQLRVLRPGTFMRSATFLTSAVTVSGLTKGMWDATRLRKRSACFSPRVRRMTSPPKIESRSTPRMAAKP